MSELKLILENNPQKKNKFLKSSERKLQSQESPLEKN